MPKKIKYESFLYRFLIEARDINSSSYKYINNSLTWSEFINDLKFNNLGSEIEIIWGENPDEKIQFSLKDASFYVRGDTDRAIEKQRKMSLIDERDITMESNALYFRECVENLAKKSGFELTEGTNMDRLKSEEKFHDDWANNEDIDSIDVVASAEVCTAPEMRYLVSQLGNLKGKKLLDVGCGLGEASVYFALQGADVTSSDLSSGMLNATEKLASRYGVTIKKHLASAENMNLSKDDKFDVIYAGNLLHHVNIQETLERIKPHLKDSGSLVTWDPLHYNPIINVYRYFATEVRTPDEHPLKLKDIKTYKKLFPNVTTNYFWLTTLVIFMLMAIAQRRNPNKERYWKVIIDESNKWEWLYKPLEKIDRFLLKIFPPLRLLCWNIVVIAKLK